MRELVEWKSRTHEVPFVPKLEARVQHGENAYWTQERNAYS